MRKAFDSLLMFSIAACALLFGTVACATNYPTTSTYPVATTYPAVPATSQEAPTEALFSAAQLDNLVAPVALYPDPLLAQVLVAATFPDQLDEAARFLRAGAKPNAIDDQPWDVSVKAVAHYPTALYMMADNLDWTTSLGQAYVDQSTDVMSAVQRLRVRARAAGYLVTTPQMEVVVENHYIALWPVYPGTLYVPIYDPALVFYPYSGYRIGPVISFGVGFAIGAWLNYDFDWYRHRIYYHGWTSRRGWVHRYRSHVHVRSVYVNNRYSHIRINRRVVDHRVNYRALDRYNAVHRGIRYDNLRRRRPRVEPRGIRRERRAPGTRREVPNKVIRRNFNTENPRIDMNRGRRFEQRLGPARPRRGVRPAPRQRQVRPRIETRPAPRRRQGRPRVQRPSGRRPQRRIERRENSVFRRERSGINPNAARQRGRSSRRQSERARPGRTSPSPRRHAPSRR